MSDELRDRRRAALSAFIKGRKLTYYAVAKAAQMSEGTLRAFLDNDDGTNSMGLPKYDAIAKAYNVPVSILLGESSVTLPIVGMVGAGDEVYPFDDGPVGSGLDHIDAPPGCPTDSVAVQVRGDSMFPAYWDGDVLIYRRDGPFDHQTCLYNECIVQVADGPTLIKRVMPGRAEGTFILESYNAPPLMDQRLEWASPVTYSDKTRRGRR